MPHGNLTIWHTHFFSLTLDCLPSLTHVWLDPINPHYLAIGAQSLCQIYMSLHINIGIKYVVLPHNLIGYCFNLCQLLDFNLTSSSTLSQTSGYTWFFMDSAHSSMSHYLHLINSAIFKASFLCVNKHILFSTLHLRHVFSTYQTETWPQRVGV